MLPSRIEMKKIIIITLALLCLCSCGKNKTSGGNEAAKRYYDAWVQVHKQDGWKQTALGSWIMEQTEGTGNPVGEFTDSLYLRLGYTISGQDGTISNTTYARVAQQLGTYDETKYYGPVTAYAKGLYAGVEEVLKGMKKGGRCKVIIPAWLITYNRYDTVQEYMEQKSDDIGNTSVYEIELVDSFEGIMQSSADSIGRYLVANFPSRFGKDPAKATADSSGTFGFYYVRTKATRETTEFKDTTIYINYIGRLLNGRVFDTTIRDTAIRYGLNRDATYEPVSIQFGDDWSDIKMNGDTKVLAGFARTLSMMHPYEKGTGVFIPTLGYSYSGSGSSIPAYAPLRFDIEVVDKK